MWNAFFAVLNWIGSPDKIINGAITAWAKAKDVDLEKYRTAEQETGQLAATIVDANVKFASLQSQYALAVLQWWPFRVVLWLLLATCAVHFALVILDNVVPFVFGCDRPDAGGELHRVYGDICAWNIPPIRGDYAEYQKQFLLFFIVAKPVDTVVAGAFNALSGYLRKR
jgi:hypothetical protein